VCLRGGRPVFRRYNIITTDDLVDAGDRLAAYRDARAKTLAERASGAVVH